MAMLATLAAYTTANGSPRRVAVLIFGPPLALSRPVPAILAARLDAHPALLLDRPCDRPGDVRVVAELQVGEGLGAVRALIADYLPRARRATRPIARPLEPEDLFGPPGAEQTGLQDRAGTADGGRWAA
jgi:hypothetical protein